MKGSGISASRTKTMDGPDGEIDPMWKDVVANLDRDSITKIAGFIDKTKRPGSLINPINHPAVQNFRQRVNSGHIIKLKENIFDYMLRIWRSEGNRQVVSISIARSDDLNNTLADFHWNWESIPNGVNVFKDVCSEDAERFFYGVMAVVLSHRSTHPIDIDTIEVRFLVPRFFRRDEDKIVKVTTLRKRVRKIFHSKKGQTSLQTLKSTLSVGESNAHGGAVVLIGPRGGKYVVKGKKKVYV